MKYIKATNLMSTNVIHYLLHLPLVFCIFIKFNHPSQYPVVFQFSNSSPVITGIPPNLISREVVYAQEMTMGKRSASAENPVL